MDSNVADEIVVAVADNVVGRTVDVVTLADGVLHFATMVLNTKTNANNNATPEINLNPTLILFDMLILRDCDLMFAITLVEGPC